MKLVDFETHFKIFIEAVAQTCSVKKVFLEISQNSQESTCAIVSLKKRPSHRCFLVNFAEFLRPPFLTEHLWWLLLSIQWTKKSNRRRTIHL